MEHWQPNLLPIPEKDVFQGGMRDGFGCGQIGGPEKTVIQRAFVKRIHRVTKSPVAA